MHLKVGEFDYVLLDDGSKGAVATIVIIVPGAKIMIIGEVEDVGGGLLVERAHIAISPPYAHVLTWGTMRAIAERILQDTGYAGIVIRGAPRTTGARPDHIPRVLGFTRRNRPEA